jgi:pimeloyl-ACP methyl ester carboxylesterase
MVKTTGRVQNFAYDERDVPPDVKSYRMIPHVVAKRARHYETIARAAEKAGHHATAAAVYRQASQTYHEAQHAIFEDDNQEKLYLYSKLAHCASKTVELSGARVATVEIPWEGREFQGLLHYAASEQPAPLIIFLPGMDMVKESAPDPLANPFARRGMHVLSIDGPGQGSSNIRKLRVTADNYERAVSAAIDFGLTLPEVDSNRIAIVGSSFGSHWGARAAAADKRVKAMALNHGVFGSKQAIFEEASPRFKQMFMYMAGISDESQFDAMAAQMGTDEAAAGIECPTLVAVGEFDPLCHLESVMEFFRALPGQRQLWLFENEFHRVTGREGVGGISIYAYLADWVKDALDGGLPDDLDRITVVEQDTGAGPYAPPITDVYLPHRYGWETSDDSTDVYGGTGPSEKVH